MVIQSDYEIIILSWILANMKFSLEMDLSRNILPTLLLRICSLRVTLKVGDL